MGWRVISVVAKQQGRSRLVEGEQGQGKIVEWHFDLFVTENVKNKNLTLEMEPSGTYRKCVENTDSRVLKQILPK